MPGPIEIVGNSHTVQVFGIKLVGISGENAKKLLFSVVFLLLLGGFSWLLRRLGDRIFGGREGRGRFWFRQGARLLTAAVLIIALISIWFSDPSRLASAAAFITAGLAIASQRLITAVAGYFIILRGKNFNVGDRIVMGGVRGDVIALGFTQTTIMEMGQPPSEQSDAPSMWVAGRQYTGRIVTITNDKIFDNPVYNYTREFPYIWEEMHVPIPYNSDRRQAESIILEAARNHTTKIAEMGEEPLEELERRYAVKREELEPTVFMRLTDNWVEMTVRFVTEDHGVRRVKDAMTREILDRLDEAKIGIASGTYEVVGMPELRVRFSDGNQP
jgi:small-conductance mechanosensitive channel